MVEAIMKILYCYADTPETFNSDNWRCYIPTRAINRLPGHTARLIALDDLAQWTDKAKEMTAWAEVIVFERNLFGPILLRMAALKQQGKTIIVDFDDSFPDLYPAHRAYPFWVAGIVDAEHKLERLPLEQFEEALHLAHAATMPSPLLAEEWRWLTPTFVVPNYIEAETYLGQGYRPHRGWITGWGGSGTHRQSLMGSGILPALKRVAKRHPEIVIMLCGDYRELLNNLDLPDSQKRFVEWTEYREWPRTLALFDIGLAPLHGALDDHRSQIKGLEYGLRHIPWIGSDRPPYANFKDLARLVPNHPDAWEQALEESYAEVKTNDGHDYLPRVEAAHQYALTQTSDKGAAQIVATYEKIREQAQR